MAVASAPPLSHSSAPAPVNADTPVSSTAVDVTRLLYMLYQDVENQINRADLKAQITLSTSAILAVMVSNMGFGLRSADIHFWSKTEWTVLCIYVVFIGLICSAIGHALLAAFPRSIGKSKKKPEDANLYFTSDIISLQPETYIKHFNTQLNSDVRENVLRQIHAKGRVLEAKFGHVRWGLKFLGLAMVVWLVARVVLAISYAKISAG